MKLLEAQGVSKTFHTGFWLRRREARALREVSLSIDDGETVGVLGESGSGKTTLLRIAAFLVPPDQGRLRVAGTDPWGLAASQRRALRQSVQIVFQDGGDSFDPRQNVAAAVAEPLANFAFPRRERRERVAQALASVGLPPELLGRYPSELSGGQRQRVGIARALVVQPRLVLLDEPVSALDVSVAAQVLNLLQDLQAQRGLAYILVSHELPVVRYLAKRVLVLYAGRVVEEGPAHEVLERPAHPYTQALRAAALTIAPGAGIPEVVPAALPSSAGCPFASRCPEVTTRCLTEEPAALQIDDGHYARCHLYERESETAPTRCTKEADPWKRSVFLRMF